MQTLRKYIVKEEGTVVEKASEEAQGRDEEGAEALLALREN